MTIDNKHQEDLYGFILVMNGFQFEPPYEEPDLSDDIFRLDDKDVRWGIRINGK